MSTKSVLFTLFKLLRSFAMASLIVDECVCAQELGSSKSKLALSYRTSTSVRVIRVPFKGSFNDPECADTADQPDTNFDFVAFAAFRDVEFVAGRQALSHDDHYPLNRLPGGNELLRLSHDGKITVSMMNEALKNYFLLLRRMMVNQARQIKPAKKLTRLVLTYKYISISDIKDFTVLC